MYSSQDLERLYLDYQSEWVPRGMTLRAYCTRNNVPLKVMENFIKGIHKRIVEVDVIGKPAEEDPQSEVSSIVTPSEQQQSSAKATNRIRHEDNRISVVIRIGNGTEVSRRGLDYSGLKQLIEKLEVLCS